MEKYSDLLIYCAYPRIETGYLKPTLLFLEPKTLSWENTRTQTQEADQSQELLETQETDQSQVPLETQELRHKKQTSLKNSLRHKKLTSHKNTP
ncbi:hypothetical protein CDAR_402061 [Caerostris darwini]|uniref:Uncharacterized protein n=1 Tax=Caerostris darwini TaxID=1538125 RepID=A0AAV4T211_9ARAC|nr:hypothetical protein CDAR_402061 [Caerostris darwini]